MTASEDLTAPESRLLAFAQEYSANQIPPPHILMIGKDVDRCLSLAEAFASQMGARFFRADANKLDILGDLTALLTQSGVVLLEQVHLLKRSLGNRLARALQCGEFEIVIGQGPALRNLKWELNKITVVATCPSRADCPSFLLREFRCILQVGEYSKEQLLEMLEDEAWKAGNIAFERTAAELLVQCSGGRLDILLSTFRKIIPHVEQIATTNKPTVNEAEVFVALKRCRVAIPTQLPQDGRFDIARLSGQEFEALIKSLLTKMGYIADLTEVTGDGGIDIVATLDRPFCGGKFLFQCKRYSEDNVVGAPSIRDFYGAVSAARTVNKGIFITTSDFTAQAKDFAEQNNIELVNGARLQQLFVESGLDS